MQKCGVLNRKEAISDLERDQNNNIDIKTNINEFVIPNQLPYIPWRHENRTMGPGSGTGITSVSHKADRRSEMKETPTVNELNSGKVEDINAASARATTTPASIALRFETSIQKNRHLEFRNMTNYVINDLFRNVISSSDIEKNLIRSATARSDGLRCPENLSTDIEGIPVHGMFYDEMKKPEDVLVGNSNSTNDNANNNQLTPRSRPQTGLGVGIGLETPREISDEQLETKAELLLATDDSFKSLVTDILHNTLFNLMHHLENFQ